MRLRELQESTQFVTVNKTLNPKLWNDGQLKPEVAEKLRAIAQAFEEFIGVDIKVIDYTITGSNANYTWTAHSDLDLHLIIPGKASDEERELFSAKKSLWSEQRDITIKGLPVECYVQGEDEPHHSTGVYSIVRGEWVVEPKKVKPKLDDAAIEAKKDAVLRMAENALLSKDLVKLRSVKDKITQMRKAGLERAGEWSVENIVFKILRNLGIIDQISDKIQELEDSELSLEQVDILEAPGDGAGEIEKRIVFSKENPPGMQDLFRHFIQVLSRPDNKMNPNALIDYLNKSYGLNKTLRDYRNFSMNNDYSRNLFLNAIVKAPD
jgi:hypothetical protein